MKIYCTKKVLGTAPSIPIVLATTSGILRSASKNVRDPSWNLVSFEGHSEQFQFISPFFSVRSTSQ